MKGYEISKELKMRRGSNDQFIKWWRKENDFLDFDLIDRYVNNFNDSEDIAGFELLGMDDMWKELKRICGDRISRINREGNNYVSWKPVRGKEVLQAKECPFTPVSLIDIFDRETKGNPVDS